MNDERIRTADDSGFDLASFLRAAVHEIANPLNAISMNAELAKLLLQRDQTAQAVEVLGRLQDDNARCRGVLRGLQRFASSMKLQARETVPARELIDSAIELFVQEHSGTSPTLDVDAIEQPIVVARAAMERVIGGLFLNAAQAGASAIKIGVQRDADWIVIDISDDGGGIPAEIRSRVIEPFFTTRRTAGHNGLGLTLADTLARAHGGDLHVDHSEIGGARIVLRLPVTPVQTN
jgi:two-component system C4-dicarboxylate transport sensor histidine kinase DctB